MSWLHDHPEIKTIRVAASDLNGVARGKRMPTKFAQGIEALPAIGRIIGLECRGFADGAGAKAGAGAVRHRLIEGHAGDGEVDARQILGIGPAQERGGAAKGVFKGEAAPGLAGERKIDLLLPADPKSLAQAAKLGQPVVEAIRGSKISMGIITLAEIVAGSFAEMADAAPADAKSPSKKNVFASFKSMLKTK